MSDLETLKTALAPVITFIAGLDPARQDSRTSLEDSKAQLDERFLLNGPVLTEIRSLVRSGVDAGWLCDREAGGVRFSRVHKATSAEEISVDAVHMQSPGPGHLHPNGEVDLSFAVSGSPTFDGAPEGWTIYAPGSWHIPTVAGGVMDILYFLPGGAIKFGPQPG